MYMMYIIFSVSETDLDVGESTRCSPSACTAQQSSGLQLPARRATSWRLYKIRATRCTLYTLSEWCAMNLAALASARPTLPAPATLILAN